MRLRYTSAIRSRRIEAGLSVREMGQHFAGGAVYYGEVERGVRVPTLDDCATIERILVAAKKRSTMSRQGPTLDDLARALYAADDAVEEKRIALYRGAICRSNCKRAHDAACACECVHCEYEASCERQRRAKDNILAHIRAQRPRL